MKAINLNSKLTINDKLLSTEIDNELVLMSIDTGKYFGLNTVGSRVWELLKTPIEVTDLLNRLQEEFNVGKEQCETEVMSLLQKMLDKNLVIFV